ncbi:MAG: DUF4838 domain-containing protein, partial [Clostridia bacterium]|nr:DUF4838 domain-containing protein [Clostridia bacterium]
MRKIFVKGRHVTSVRYVYDEGSELLKNAVFELRKYLFKAAEVTDDGDFPVKLSLSDEIERDGFAVRVSGEAIEIVGGKNGGIMHGVYEFLRHYAGMRFYTPTLEVYGSGDINVDEDYLYTPVFEYRQSDWHCVNDVTWSLKNGINNRPIPDSLGGHVRYGVFVHTISGLTDTSPDGQPCLSDPFILEKAKKRVREILEKDPGCTIISVSQNDNQHYCTCEKCATIDREEDSHMGTLLRFVNAVADDIRDDYPHVIIDTLAYQYTRKPPLITRPRENVCVRLCSIECCFSHPLDDRTCAQNRKFHDDLIAWNKICDRLYIWDYVTDFLHYVPTYPNLSVLRENMRFFADHHVRGMYPEGQHNAPETGEFAEMKAYLLARLMWDPYMSAAEYSDEIDGFMEAYYGPGWRYLRAYIDLLEAFTKGRHMGIATDPLDNIDGSKLAAMEDCIDVWWEKTEEMAGDRIGNVRK